MPVFTPRLNGVRCERRSPNYGPRAVGHERPDYLILHYTGMASGQSAIDWLCDPASQVSCHYVVTEEGDVLQLVDEAERAWCCGRSVWHGLTDINSASINIEIVNGGHDFGLPPYPEVQIDRVIELCRDIVDRHAITRHRVLAHSDIAPSRKQDPGEHFPWHKLAGAGLGAWTECMPSDNHGLVLAPSDHGEEVAAHQADLSRFGYGLATSGHYDRETETVVRAFQRHFRPWRVDGLADGETRQRLKRLLAA